MPQCAVFSMVFKIIIVLLATVLLTDALQTPSNHAFSVTRLSAAWTRSTLRTTTRPLYTPHSSQLSASSNNERDNGNFWTGISNLWDEIIEVSTYGPSERKMLKAQRERQEQMQQLGTIPSSQDRSSPSTSIAIASNTEGGITFDDDSAWLEAFNSAKHKEDDEGEDNLDFDGYALQELLVSKWGVSLDVDFQSIGDQLYCTILPLVGYGSPLRSRHETELDYLMHLQGVVEILDKYDNLDGFVSFIDGTQRVPKRGTDSVPFRLDLSREDYERIMVLRNR